MLLAKLATNKAKPNGQYYLSDDVAQAYLDGLAATDLPGVGWKLNKELKKHNIETVADLRTVAKSTLKVTLCVITARASGTNVLGAVRL